MGSLDDWHTRPFTAAIISLLCDHERETETERDRDRITRVEMEKWNQMTSLRFQTGETGRHQKLPASLTALFGAVLEKVK